MRSRSSLHGATFEVMAALGTIDDPGGFGARALEALAVAVPFDLGSYNEVDTAAGLAHFVALPDTFDPEGVDVEGFPQLVAQNPILRHQEATGDGSARRLSDFLSQEALHELPLYQRVYGPLGIEYQAVIGLATKAPLVVAFALNRCEADFSVEEVVLLDLLRPHLVQAYRNVQALDALRGVDGALAEEGRALLVLDPGGRAAHVSPWARERLVEHYGPAGLSGLPDPVATWLQNERRPRRPDGAPRLRRPLVHLVGERQLVARFVSGAGDRPDVVVLEEQTPERGIDGLRRLGLTPRESELLWLLTRGATTGELARRLRIAPGTVSKHLEHIYRKLGVVNRIGAVSAAVDALVSPR